MKNFLLIHILPSVFRFLTRLLYWSCPYTVIGKQNLKEDANRGGKGFIMASWHQRFFGGIIYNSRLRLSIMISQSKDGEIISRVIKKLGMNPVRGSGRKGALKASLEIIRLLKKGKNIGHVVDGPLGPAFIVKEGIIYFAQKSGAPVIISAISAKRYWEFNSWDRFRVPKPFSPVLIEYSKPFYVPPDINDKELEENRLELENFFNALMARADNYWQLSNSQKKEYRKKVDEKI